VAEERSVRGPVPPYTVEQLQVPVVYGFGDAFPVSAMRTNLVAAVDQLDLVCIADADHHAHRSAPEAFADLVRLGIKRALG
jgi:pimeloyl-ACP methyl ester carboxylesterase